MSLTTVKSSRSARDQGLGSITGRSDSSIYAKQLLIQILLIYNWATVSLPAVSGLQ